MAVIGTAQETPDSPEEFSASTDRRTYRRKFLVRCSSMLDGPLQVTAAPGIPRKYSPYVFGTERDQYALALNFSAARIDSGFPHWHVHVEYSTPEPRQKGEKGDTSEDPLLWIPEASTSMEKLQEAVYAVYDISGVKAPAGVVKAPDGAPVPAGEWDFFGLLGGDAQPGNAKDARGPITPCRASNGEVFDPPPMRDASRLVLSITRNESITSNHPRAGIQYADAVNADRFWGGPPGVWKCQGITAERQTRQINNRPCPYLKVTYKFEARLTWDLILLDAGTFYTSVSPEKVPFAGPEIVRRKFITHDGHPTTGPLDGKGGKLADGAVPVFRVYRIYRRLRFKRLGLPQSFAQCA